MKAKQIIAAFIPFWGLAARANDETQRYDEWDFFLDLEKVILLLLGIINSSLVQNVVIRESVITFQNFPLYFVACFPHIDTRIFESSPKTEISESEGGRNLKWWLLLLISNRTLIIVLLFPFILETIRAFLNLVLPRIFDQWFFSLPQHFALGFSIITVLIFIGDYFWGTKRSNFPHGSIYKIQVVFITMTLLVGYEFVEWFLREKYLIYAFEVSVIDTTFDLIFGFAGIWLFFVLQERGIDLTNIQWVTRERQAVEVRKNE